MDGFNSNQEDKSPMEEDVAKLADILLGFRRNLSNLHQIIGMAESKPELHCGSDSYRLDMESKAIDLEIEVQRLRQDLLSIKDLLGLNLEKSNSSKT
jgi:hypothetical protein